ncbi:hypothetical protein D3C86_2127090 [compost metagenome]
MLIWRANTQAHAIQSIDRAKHGFVRMIITRSNRAPAFEWMHGHQRFNGSAFVARRRFDLDDKFT